MAKTSTNPVTLPQLAAALEALSGAAEAREPSGLSQRILDALHADADRLLLEASDSDAVPGLVMLLDFLLVAAEPFAAKKARAA